jgi:hypothetical protein
MALAANSQQLPKASVADFALLTIQVDPFIALCCPLASPGQ